MNGVSVSSPAHGSGFRGLRSRMLPTHPPSIQNEGTMAKWHQREKSREAKELRERGVVEGRSDGSR